MEPITNVIFRRAALLQADYVERSVLELLLQDLHLTQQDHTTHLHARRRLLLGPERANIGSGHPQLQRRLQLVRGYVGRLAAAC